MLFNDSPNVSVIVPTYKRPQYLKEAVTSVLTQSEVFLGHEILVVDNSPTPDKCLIAFCDQYSGLNIRYIHEPKPGLHNARHRGANEAIGEILVYIDDDVICPSNWLKAMIAPYKDERVAMVAGKVVLKWEGKPQYWAYQFSGLYSAHDLGEEAHIIQPYGGAVGCNMSIRKSVLFEVGGFNPDGFRDPDLVHLRGDGEVGLARKVHNANLIVWYTPFAWLEHRVPASRMTLDYILRRSALGGIENSYSDLRNKKLTVLQLIGRSGKSLLGTTFHSLHFLIHFLNVEKRYWHITLVSRYIYRFLQHCRQILSSELRRHTFQQSYFSELENV